MKPLTPEFTPSTLATSPKERKTYLTALLESSKSVDRNSKFDKSAISRGNTPPNSYLVGQEHENVSIKSFPPFHVHGDRGTGNQATIRVYQPIGAVGTHVSDPSIPGRQQNSRYSRKGVRNALGEKGAITQLFAEVVKGTLRLDEVQHLAKHQALESLLRYNADPVTTALALGTQNATKKLRII